MRPPAPGLRPWTLDFRTMFCRIIRLAVGLELQRALHARARHFFQIGKAAPGRFAIGDLDRMPGQFQETREEQGPVKGVALSRQEHPNRSFEGAAIGNPTRVLAHPAEDCLRVITKGPMQGHKVEAGPVEFIE